MKNEKTLTFFLPACLKFSRCFAPNPKKKTRRLDSTRLCRLQFKLHGWATKRKKNGVWDNDSSLFVSSLFIFRFLLEVGGQDNSRSRS